MGLGPDWLATKHRSPAEDAALREMGKHPTQRAAPSASHRHRLRSGRNPSARLAGRPPTATFVSFQTNHVTFAEARETLRTFIRNNRWRLHDLFARLKQYEEDYRLSADLVTHWLLVSGRVQAPTTGVSFFHEDELSVGGREMR